MSVHVYVEGGGNKATNSNCRRAFHTLLTGAGFEGRLPRVSPCGSRNEAFDDFRTALFSATGNDYPVLLVDSEDRVTEANLANADPSGAWKHLVERDGWNRPEGAQDDQAQLMVTSMETWLLADRQALVAYFPNMNVKALPADTELEDRRRQDVLSDLKNATRPSSKGEYSKGRDSFALLAQVNPGALSSRLPHFRRLLETLDTHLPPH